MLIEITIAKTDQNEWKAEVVGTNFGIVIKPKKHEAIDLLKAIVLTDMLSTPVPLPNSIVFIMSDRFDKEQVTQA